MPYDRLDELAKYLPCDVTSGENTDFRIYHIKALRVNYEEDVYTFEFFAWHILYMSFLQKIAFILYKIDPVETKQLLISQAQIVRILSDARSPYDLSEINEKTLCEITKHAAIGFHSNKTKNLKDIISRRDHIAHCSGVLDLDRDDINNSVNKSLIYAKEIQTGLENTILKIWDNFIIKLTANDNNYSLIHDSVVDFLKDSFLSINDILLILRLNTVSKSTSSIKNNILSKKIAIMHLAIKGSDFDGEDITADQYIDDIKQHRLSNKQKTWLNDELESSNSYYLSRINSPYRNSDACKKIFASKTII